jgi:hypothetical protein
MTASGAVSTKTVVWIAPGATGFSCLCEPCLDRAYAGGASFPDAVRDANVRGTLVPEADIGFVRCRSGHQLVVRRVGRIDRRPRNGRRRPQLAPTLR